MFGGCKEDVTRVVMILLREGSKRGLELSTEITAPEESKCSVWCPPGNNFDEDPLGLGIKPAVDNSFVHIGAPVGDQTRHLSTHL